VFRAEPHDTVRHLAEYVSLDAKLGYISDHHDVLAVLRSVLAGMAEAISTAAPEALRALAHGMPPHGGFAIGLERWVSRLVGAANIREVTLFPRDLHRLAP
jgi:aspartyl/asparaginyl-tRNA synthetase